MFVVVFVLAIIDCVALDFRTVKAERGEDTR